MDNTDKLNQAFSSLRKQGFIARQRFMCCGSCASAELCNQVEKMSEKRRAKVKGVVFTTRQDRGRTLFIKHGPLETTGCGTIGLTEGEVGRLVYEALAHQGLQPKWDGNPRSCIEVQVW